MNAPTSFGAFSIYTWKDTVVASGIISKATIHLPIEKIILHQVGAESIDVRFLMKGAFKITSTI